MSIQIDNRRLIALRDKIRIASIALKQNGPLWSATLATYYAASGLASWTHEKLIKMREAGGLPGMNSPELNRAIWDVWNWQSKGEEWSLSEAWKESVIETFLKPHIPPGSDVLEIGPGGGRWSEHLVPLAKKYVGVDISSTCIENCRKRFASATNARFVVGSGKDLHELADSSFDALWSFDVFVHINRQEVESYLKDILRVLRPSGIAVIHHGTLGGLRGGWRSDLSQDDMMRALQDNGFHVLLSQGSWQHQGVTYDLDIYQDHVTVFEKRKQT